MGPELQREGGVWEIDLGIIYMDKVIEIREMNAIV